MVRELLNFLDGEADHYFHDSGDAMMVCGDVEFEVEDVKFHQLALSKDKIGRVYSS